MNALRAISLAVSLLMQSSSPTATPGQTYKVDIVTPPADTPLFKWYLAFTAIGVVVNAAIFVLILRQTKLTKIAAEAAKTSAETAKNSAEFAEKAMRHSERADVLLFEAGLSTGKDIFPHSQVVLRFKNFGQTRANNVLLNMSLIIQDTKETEMTHGPMILGAGSDQSLFITLSTSGLNKVFVRNLSMTFSGKVTYVDVFGFPHTTVCTGTFDVPTRTFQIGKNEGD